MSKAIFAVSFWSLFLSQVLAGINQITIYEGVGQTGDSHTFTKKYANLSDWRFFLNNTGSYCLTGFWQFWDQPNYQYKSTQFNLDSTTETCSDRSFSAYYSGRFLGSDDFDTPAISLYKSSGEYTFGGEEYVVTGPAGNNFQFTPSAAISFGNSSWTLFTGKDFDGDSKCFTPNSPPDHVYSGWMLFIDSFVVKSLVKGCDIVEVARNINLFKGNLN